MNPIRVCLVELLTALEQIGDDHGEVFDSEAREQVGNALMEAFVRQSNNYDIPATLGMLTDNGNRRVRAAVIQFIDCAIPICDGKDLICFHDRLKWMQDDAVTTPCGNDYEEFIGHTPQDWYDAEGNVIWDRVR